MPVVVSAVWTTSGLEVFAMRSASAASQPVTMPHMKSAKGSSSMRRES